MTRTPCPTADPLAVADGAGRVHGVPDLRGADASVLPSVLSPRPTPGSRCSPRPSCSPTP
ncbi:GMC oxidoreductase [Streptomyces sp. WP-1]|uniref:GMC oxidoreductase n=1 Tax=Streptomyces sp. WP-1 TaxID=3041497 RepID=UPI00351B50B8